MEAVEAELKTMEKNVPKIRAILSSMDVSNATVPEHVHNRQARGSECHPAFMFMAKDSIYIVLRVNLLTKMQCVRS